MSNAERNTETLARTGASHFCRKLRQAPRACCTRHSQPKIGRCARPQSHQDRTQHGQSTGLCQSRGFGGAVVHHDEMRKRPENCKAGHPGLPDHDQREREQQRQHNCRANAAGNPRELPLVCIEELHGDADPVRPACSRDTNEAWRSNRRPKSGPLSPKRQRGPRAPRERGQAAMPVASVLSPTGMPG
jgi:hypothetical protein